MSRFKEWVMQLSIRKKLIFYSYLIITPILLCISALLFWNNYQVALREENVNCAQSVQNLSDSIEVVQNNIIKMGVYISINDEITQILTSDTPEKLNQDVQLWFHNAPLRIIQDMASIDGQIRTIAIYPENGVNPYLRCMDRSSYIGELEQVQKEAIYGLVVQEKGKFLWQRIDQNPKETYQSNLSDKIVMYREIYDLSRKNKLGYLVIGSSADIFDGIGKNALRNDREAIMIVSEYGSELVRCGEIPDDIFLSVADEQIDWTEENGKLKIGVCQEYRVYRCQSLATGTITYKIVPKVGILDFAASIIFPPLAFLLGFLIGMCPIMILVSNIVSKPLHVLCVAMEKFKKGDFEQKVQVATEDEVGEAAACFNDMVDAIRDLINKNYVMALKEKESELDVLQAQINPHFLYNTLDSLYWKAIEENEEIAEDIVSLSHLFRFVLNRGNSIITVRNEAELVERYLHIQKMRFGKRLEYQVCMEEDILEEEIPKLILQPFVENAIVHGFEKGKHKFHLMVDGKREENHIVFCICDNGIGMNEVQLASIWSKSDSAQQSSQRIGKYAIKNVKDRLELLYHNEYMLKIDSIEGSGTTVMISIPSGLKGM